MTYIHSLLARNVRKARRNLGYTQSYVAEQCNVSTGHISEIEHGNKFPSARLFEQLAHVLALEPYELMLDGQVPEVPDHHQSVSSFADQLKRQLVVHVDELVREYLNH
ncbi:MAG: XRE family transcriptional regulator [Spirochaetaceae bacterium]|nr:MAG: XRE family transcriptional regulator [Spirochaetaceae bacterium]